MSCVYKFALNTIGKIARKMWENDPQLQHTKKFLYPDFGCNQAIFIAVRCSRMFKNVQEWRMWPCHCIKASTKSNDQCEKRRDISVWFAHKVYLQYPFVSAFLLCVVRFSEFETPLKIMHCQQSAMCAREMYELTTNHLFCIEYHPTVSHPLYRVDTFQGKFFRMKKKKIIKTHLLWSGTVRYTSNACPFRYRDSPAPTCNMRTNVIGPSFVE